LGYVLPTGRSRSRPGLTKVEDLADVGGWRKIYFALIIASGARSPKQKVTKI